MRVVFLGSPQDVIAPLQALLDAKVEVVGIVSQPARPAGRKKKLMDPPLALFAMEHKLPLLQPEKASSADFLAQFAAWKPDVVITAAYGQILSQAFLDIPTRATINIHPSLLPEYRGATPVPAALLAGRGKTGISILFTVKKLDAGNLILQEDYELSDGDRSGLLTEKLFHRGGTLVVEALKLLEDQSFVGEPQDEGAVSFCGKITKSDGLVDWQLTASEIFNRFRAFDPWPGTFSFLAGARINFTDMALAANSEGQNLAAGEFLFDKPTGALFVGTGDECLAVHKLKKAGGKEMAAAAFANGLIKDQGMRFENV